MCRSQRFPDGAPNLMLLVRIGSIRNSVAGLILHRDLCDLIAAAAILLITKARVIWIELHNRIPISNRFIRIDGDGTHVDVVREERLLCYGLYFCRHSFTLF